MSANGQVTIGGETYYEWTDSDSDFSTTDDEGRRASTREDLISLSSHAAIAIRDQHCQNENTDEELDEFFREYTTSPSIASARVSTVETRRPRAKRRESTHDFFMGRNRSDPVASRKRKKNKEEEENPPSSSTHRGGVYANRLPLVQIRRDLEWDVENDPSEKTDVQQSHRKPCTGRFQKNIDTLLQEGEDPDDAYCWGCEYGDRNGKGVSAAEWNQLVRMFCSSILGGTQPHILARAMHDFFTKRCVIDISELAMHSGEKAKVTSVQDGSSDITRLWSPYKIIRHFFMHELSPQVVTATQLWYVNDAIMLHMESGLSLRHDTSQREIISKEGVDLLDKLFNIQSRLYNRTPKKMLGYNPKMLLPEDGYSVLNEHKPIVSTHTAVDTSVYRTY